MTNPAFFCDLREDSCTVKLAACFVACSSCQVSNASVNFTGQLSAGGNGVGGGTKEDLFTYSIET